MDGMAKVTMKDLICLSCKKRVTNTVGTTSFICPKCGKDRIVRCKNCRQLGARYKCNECGFEGPN